MDDDLNNLSEQEKTLSPALYANFDEVACHVMGVETETGAAASTVFQVQKAQQV